MTAVTLIKDLFHQNQGRIAVVLIILVWFYLLVNFGEQTWHANQLQAEVSAQRDAIQDIQAENARLQAELDVMQSPAYDAYVSQVARRDLTLAYPDETLLLVRWQEPAAAVEASDGELPGTGEERPNWKRWLDRFFGED